MILNIITIIALTFAILFLIILILKPVENFAFFRFDANLKEIVDQKNLKSRKENIERNLIENDIKKRNTIDKISEEVDKFENVLNFIRENINNIPICREIDLRPDLRPTCSNRSLKTCTLNNYCYIDEDSSGIKTCANKVLESECADILEQDSNGRRTGRATRMFVYPSVLEQIK